ncbi:hypothetical protein PGTUg99_010491 [Puccinia graminis f. sp. tritici]|uniref:Uncharacterized protein n=1 Tax=Puccinia graminis f. sp. tritici TaxID=56615 RepID=A0A5B0R8J6_PUCGR|nr:hypothetical protein PGTUg99_010491 [Puccinia graminis f. sp. tritici]
MVIIELGQGPLQVFRFWSLRLTIASLAFTTSGLKLSLIVIPGGLLHQFRQHIKLSQSLSTSAHTTASAPTTTIFWNRRPFSLLSIIPGGIGIGVGAGLSNAYLHSLQSCSPNQPSSIADPEQQKP